MIAIGGPPLGGKSVLAARLAECLPRAIKLEAIDDLSRGDPTWQPEGPGRRTLRRPGPAMVARAAQIWESRRPGAAPTLLVVARFATTSERRRAKAAARSAGMRFLFVEARSRDERALRRLPREYLSREELAVRLERYRVALREYQPLSRVETVLLPGLRLARVLSSLERAVDRVLGLWRVG
jgi:hypothetical protein